MTRTNRQKAALSALNLDLFQPEPISPPAPATIHAKIREHAQRCVDSTINGGPPDVAAKAPTLPSEAELYRMFDVYNWLYFGGRLPKVNIEYSARMRTAGSYTPHQRTIRIGRRYHQIFPEEITDTLKHEMIHIRYLHHDTGFKAEARRIGASIRARSHPSLRRPPKHVYICPNCGSEYPRQKRLRMASCGICSKRGEFDPRYKLRLLSSARRSAAR